MILSETRIKVPLWLASEDRERGDPLLILHAFDGIYVSDQACKLRLVRSPAP
jgi:hypothetical protein